MGREWLGRAAGRLRPVAVGWLALALGLSAVGAVLGASLASATSGAASVPLGRMGTANTSRRPDPRQRPMPPPPSMFDQPLVPSR